MIKKLKIITFFILFFSFTSCFKEPNKGNNTNVKLDKEVNLTSAEGGESSESAQKEESSGSSCKTNKPCSHCGKHGHAENTCWDKFPDKAPAWFREKSVEKSVTNKERESSNVEVEITL